MRVGEEVTVMSVLLAGHDQAWRGVPRAYQRKPVRGRVIWLHPERRFALVEIPVKGGIVRECFAVRR